MREAARARNPQRRQTIDQEADQRRQQQPGLQLDRRGDVEPAGAHRQAGVIGGGQSFAGRERVDRHQRLGRAVEAGRMGRLRLPRRRSRGSAARWPAASRAFRSRRACDRATACLRLRRACVGVAGEAPAWATTRRSISTNRPEIGRFDQVVSAVTWNSTISPLPRLTAVTSGVPSASRAQVLSARPGSGSASTWREIVTSSGANSPTNGLGGSKAAMCLGVSQDSAPPSVRPPRRRAVGIRSSSPAARRVPAKRISTPPPSTNSASLSWAGPGGTLMSASTSADGFSSMSARIGSEAPARFSRISAKGCRARLM